MKLVDAMGKAKRWANAARAMEKIARSSGYSFMASDSGDEAEVLEALIEEIEKTKGEAV